jgi:protein-disulfide isomerase
VRWAVSLLVAVVTSVGLGAQAPPASTVSSVGPADAAVVLTVFSDFSCEPCGHAAVVLQEVVAARPERVRIVFKHAPADGSSREAHLAALAAARLGRFWEMHSILFANQDRLSRLDTIEMAAQLGFDPEQFQQALSDPGLPTLLESDIAEARSRGIEARPTIILDGRALPARVTREELLAMVDRAR